MTIRLRAHHLLCLLTYVGRGYSPAFTRNYDRIASCLSRGDPISLVEGPDDICAGWLGDPEAHCLLPRLSNRDAAAAASLTAFLGRPVAPGLVLVPDAALLSRLREAFTEGSIRPACAACQWSDLCTNIARDGFPGVRVRAEGSGTDRPVEDTPFPPPPPSPISRPQPEES